MDKERWERIRCLFREAAERPERERRAWLESDCHDDPSLVDEVLELLGSSTTTGSGIDEIIDETAADYASTLPDGHRIGPYRVLDTLGSGGMGQVYLSERADDEFRQRVAIKTVGWLGASPELVERFRRERQILADLKHPYIARLLDGGQAENGTPYLVMEYVDGRAITDWCEERELPVRERLRLFIKVCDAVRYAHRSLVIHRDIKPTNILVDADGDPKLLDFGIAKLLEPGAEAGPFVTRADMRVLTPEYASPEQVRGETATTATDVYGLGLLLYQLMTGRFPYDVSDKTSPQLADIICNTEPTPPSTVVVRGDDAPCTAQTPAQLARALAGDLDNIVMTTLRKEPERRYESVGDLARDVENYLDHRPIAARTPSLGYRVGKFVGRNGPAVVAGTAVMLAVVAMTAWHTWRLSIERDVAQQERRTAEAATEFLIDLFKVSDPMVSLGETLTAREVLDAGAAKLRDGLADTPVVRARLLQTLGAVYERLGLYDEAQELLEEGAELNRAALPRTNETHIRGLEQLAWIHYRREEWPRANELAREALALRESLKGPNDPSLVHPLNMLGTTAFWQDDLDGALAYYNRALSLLEGDDEDTGFERARTLNHLGITYAYIGRSDEAESAYLRSLEIRKQIYEDHHPRIAAAKANIATFYHGINRFDKARPFALEALEADRAAFGDGHADVAFDLGLLAGIHLGLEEFHTAEAYARQSVDAWRMALGPEHSRYGTALDRLATIRMELGELDDALETAERAYAVLSAANGADHTMTADALFTRGSVRVRRQEYAAAKADLETAVEIRASRFDENNGGYQDALRMLAQAELGLGNLETAERQAGRVLSLAESAAPADPLSLRRALSVMSYVLRETGDAERLAEVETRLAALDERASR